jgi:hypothetical protein
MDQIGFLLLHDHATDAARRRRGDDPLDWPEWQGLAWIFRLPRLGRAFAPRGRLAGGLAPAPADCRPAA